MYKIKWLSATKKKENDKQKPGNVGFPEARVVMKGKKREAI